jgi:hypothetical protein
MIRHYVAHTRNDPDTDQTSQFSYVSAITHSFRTRLIQICIPALRQPGRPLVRPAAARTTSGLVRPAPLAGHCCPAFRSHHRRTRRVSGRRATTTVSLSPTSYRPSVPPASSGAHISNSGHL